MKNALIVTLTNWFELQKPKYHKSFIKRDLSNKKIFIFHIFL